VNSQKITEAANVLQAALEQAAALLKEAVADGPLPETGVQVADKRRGRMSPNRLLAGVGLTDHMVAALAAKGITKVGQARRVLAGEFPAGVNSNKLTAGQRRALRRVLD